MGVVVTDETTKSLYAAFVKRLRDEMGIKFQLVLYNKAADYLGICDLVDHSDCLVVLKDIPHGVGSSNHGVNIFQHPDCGFGRMLRNH